MGFFHLVYPNRPLGFSEYGAEGMPNLHSAHPRRGDHTEEYQAKYHEYMLKCFDRHPWLWATHVWNMFDFAADARDQGGGAYPPAAVLANFKEKDTFSNCFFTLFPFFLSNIVYSPFLYTTISLFMFVNTFLMLIVNL